MKKTLFALSACASLMASIALPAENLNRAARINQREYTTSYLRKSFGMTILGAGVTSGAYYYREPLGRAAWPTGIFGGLCIAGGLWGVISTGINVVRLRAERTRI